MNKYLVVSFHICLGKVLIFLDYLLSFFKDSAKHGVADSEDDGSDNFSDIDDVEVCHP